MSLLKKLTQYIRSDSEIQAAFLIGSRARSDCPADEYSDVDMVIITEQPVRYLDEDRWLASIGAPRISFTEDTFLGGKERRILLEGGADLDLIVLTQAQAEGIQTGGMDELLARGHVLLKDKPGLAQTLEEAVRRVSAQNKPALAQEEFTNLAQDFWFHAVWAAKKLARGELLYAKYCLDAYMKQRLLALVEHHARVNGCGDVWYNGRFIERWAQPWVLEGLAAAYAHYDPQDMARALLATMDLFRDLAAALPFSYPKDAEVFSYETVKKIGGAP